MAHLCPVVVNHSELSAMKIGDKGEVQSDNVLCSVSYRYILCPEGLNQNDVLHEVNFFPYSVGLDRTCTSSMRDVYIFTYKESLVAGVLLWETIL